MKVKRSLKATHGQTCLLESTVFLSASSIYSLFCCYLYALSAENTCMLPHQVSTGTTRLPAGKNIFKPKERVDIDCDEGYRTSTFKERDSFHCGVDGEWSNTPDCQGNKCVKAIALTCSNFTAIHISPNSIKICKWSLTQIFHFATEIFCSRPRSSDVNIPYWPRIFSYKYKETLPYSCDSNYKRPAEDATCQVEGWKPKPLCSMSILLSFFVCVLSIESQMAYLPLIITVMSVRAFK